MERRLDGVRRDLSRGRQRLTALARGKGRSDLVERLREEPPPPLLAGYGILPTIRDKPAAGPAAPSEKTYSLGLLEGEIATARREALRTFRSARRTGTLEDGVAAFERGRDGLRTFEEHLAYHAFWQQAVVDWADYFAERNRLVAEMRSIVQARARGDGRTALAERTRQVLEQLAPFRRTPGLRAKRRGDGSVVLPVTVHTDIDDAPFLAAFAASVRETFDSASARARRFSLALDVEFLSPRLLWPEGPPAQGEPIDLEAHLARFPAGALVLTTGAASTNAMTGRAVLLGPEALDRRELAHEFAHLLGFNDAYLRGYDGSPGDPYGVALVEWTGLANDLMGAPATGDLDEAMVDTLITVYAGTGSP